MRRVVIYGEREMRSRARSRRWHILESDVLLNFSSRPPRDATRENASVQRGLKIPKESIERFRATVFILDECETHHTFVPLIHNLRIHALCIFIELPLAL
jgi:hypothetical protein